ncbi:MAG: hypothetical protein WAV50_03345 [Minisyncoccia bacterium]
MKTFKRKTFYTGVLAALGAMGTAQESWPMTPSPPPPVGGENTLDFNSADNNRGAGAALREVFTT